MKSVTVQSRVSPELKEEAEAMFNQMGMSIADGIRMFLQQTVNSYGLPFQPKVKEPNAETIEAMEELANGGGIRADSIEELLSIIHDDSGDDDDL